ncbi:hypothetical protein EI171_16400 [Bradyrhizobium sp. LCT2]|nr:hypothetical protein EI171_16400 [Bradyrhizobium sp. LCT2]
MSGPTQTNPKFPSGSRIQVKPTAGPRLAGKTGRVIGVGYYPKSLRVVLDGSKAPLTLHADYVVAIDARTDHPRSD